MAVILQENNRSTRKSLSELLISEELLTQDQLSLALNFQKAEGGQLRDILINHKLIKPEDLAGILSLQYNLPYIDLQRHKIQPKALKLIPESIARKHTLIPLDILGNALLVVMADPEDMQTIQDLQARTSSKIEVAIGLPQDIQRAIDINYRAAAEIEKRVQEFSHSPGSQLSLKEELTAKTPIAQTVDLIILQAVRDRASDIHIEPQNNRLRVRYRIDGTLYDMFNLPISAHIPLISRIKILADMNIAEQRKPQDGQMTFKSTEKQIDIRVASLNTAYGERLALRILDKSLALYTLGDLGLDKPSRRRFESVMRSPYGLFLIGGPTGSGKTTTLYALINSLNRTERNIMTVEDPIEYRFDDINQTQVNLKAGVTFPAGLRAIMRHDPNVILVGEIRDKETASIVIQAALTGHLVLSSIHANNAIGVLFRLLDLGVEPFLIVSTLTGVSTQRMVRKLCPHCRVSYQPSEVETQIFANNSVDLPQRLFRKGPGCNLCANTGFQGRTGLFEVMLMSDTIRKMLMNNVNAVEIEAQAVKEGLLPIRQDGLNKAREGLIDLQEINHDGLMLE
jgi:type II secretory ATPase GspE/PulE/Tfp pilus assembly ATPase PilB-like protein